MLLLVKLRELVRKRQAFEAGIADARAAPGAERVEVKLADLLEAARAHGIVEVDEFLKCELFVRAGFEWDAARKVVVRNY